MGITYGKIILFHGIPEGSVDKKISKIWCNKKTVYDYFNNPFPYYCGGQDLDPTHFTIDNRNHLNKREIYTPDLLPSDISIAS